MKTIGEILDKNNTVFAKLIKKTKTARTLSCVFQNMLDASFAKNCSFANLEGKILTILVTNASWATKLRYAIPDLIKNLRTQPEFANITTIRYLVDQKKLDCNGLKKTNKLSSNNEYLWKETIVKLKEKTDKT